VPGDFHEVELPAERYDRVLLANVLHLEDEARAAALVSRVSRAVRPGGEVVVVDMLADATCGQLGQPIYELHLAMRTGGGRAHPRPVLTAWLAAAGHPQVELVDLGQLHAGLAALVARR
jgi:C-methyltransferase